MPNITITQLPAAGPITGTELVPIVQNGQTLRTTTGAISASPSQTQTFLTLNQEPTLINSRYLQGGTGVGLTDNGALSYLQIVLNGASGSLEAAANGIIVKTGSASVTNRSIVVSGAGLSITDGDGIAGNPTIALSGIALAMAQLSGTGFVAIVGGTTIAGRELFGTAQQINVTNGNGSNSPVFSLASDAVLPGTGAVTIPIGTTAQRPVGQDGMVRFNTDLGAYEVYKSGSWGSIAVNAVTLINTGTGLTGGPITTTGTIAIANTGVAAATYGSSTEVAQIAVNAQGQITSASNVAISASAIGAVTSVSGTPNEITATGTTSVVLSLPTSLAFTGKTVTGGTFNMTAATVNSLPVVTTDAVQVLTNKTISGTSNTLTNIANSSLTNSSISFTYSGGISGSASVSLGGSNALSLSNIPNSSLQNSSVTIGTTGISLGGTSLTLGGLTSVTLTQDPVSALQVATKQYVDAVAEGLHVHASCAAATTGTLASITGGTVTYNNGTAGVGATLTLSVALTTLDGYSLQNGDRILVKNEATQANNGIYTWATGGTVLTRATDFDTSTEIASGDFTFVTNGTLYANTGWVQTNPVTTVGTDPIVWLQFSGAGTYTAGTGLTLAGSQFSITNTGVAAATYGTASSVPTIAVNAQGQITSASNTSIAINANQITSGTIQNSQLQNSAITVNSTSISLGGSGTITAVNPNALTIGTGLSGTSYDGSAPITIAIATTGVTAASYGTASSVPTIAVNAQGQITSASNTSIAIDANQITTGTISSSLISGSYTGITGVGTLTAGTWNASTIGVAYGGTGQTTYTDGQLLIGNTVGNTLTKATLTAGSGISITNGNGSITIASTGGGSVTSVAQTFTGGLISVSGSPITTSGTLALTVAGTSGGIPYFSSASTWATSAALAANALVIGGGAGAAPATTTTGTGVLTALGNNANSTGGFATINGTATLTNKRIDPRVSSTTSTASLTPDISSFDQYALTAQAATLAINAPIGTPVDGNKLIFRILDNGVSQTLNWNGTYTAIGVTIPTATTASKMTYVGCIYNAANTRWDVVAVTTQA